MMIDCRVAHGRWHGNGLAVATCLLAPLGNRQLAGDAPCLIKRQRIDDLDITRIGVTVDIGEALTVRVHDLESAVQGLNRPGCREAAQMVLLARKNVTQAPSKSVEHECGNH